MSINCRCCISFSWSFVLKLFGHLWSGYLWRFNIWWCNSCELSRTWLCYILLQCYYTILFPCFTSWNIVVGVNVQVCVVCIKLSVHFAVCRHMLCWKCNYMCIHLNLSDLKINVTAFIAHSSWYFMTTLRWCLSICEAGGIIKPCVVYHYAALELL
jgi:hypothetical protein